MDSNHNDISLFERIAVGDEEAFRIIFHAYNQTLYPFLMSVVKNDADAKEIIQEVFMKVWLKRETLTAIDNPGGWLHTVAANTAYTYLRREARYSNHLQTAAGFPERSAG